MAKRFYEGYAGRSEAKKTMKKDGKLIYEDHSAPCLLPTEVISKDFPSSAPSNIGMIGGDLFMGVQKQSHKDAADLAKIRNPKKY